MALVAEITKSAASEKKVRDVVIETIRSQDEQSKEKDAANFIFKTLKKANALVQNAAGHELRPESSAQGVEAQVQSLRIGLDRIEAWLAERKV